MGNLNASAANGFFESGRRFFETENKRRDAQMSYPTSADKARCKAMVKQLMKINRQEWDAEDKAWAATDRKERKIMSCIFLSGIVFTALVYLFVYIMGLIT